MESFLTYPEETIKFRIRRNQRRAMSVGIFYWVGILLLLCFSVFPYVSGLSGFEGVPNSELWIVTFFEPFNALASGGAMTSNVLLPLLLSILYILYLVISFITAIVGTTRLFRITKRNPTNKWGYNRAARAMKVMGKCFSLMFFMMMMILVLGVMLLDGRPTLFFYLAFGVALFFHFIGNFRACKVSFFETTEDRFNPIERKNTLTRKIGLGRNVLQMVCICLILLLIDRLAMYDLAISSFFGILDGGEFAVIPLLLFITVITLLVAIAHATGGAEYCRYGEHVRGKRVCKNSAYVIAALSLICSVLAVVAGDIHPSATQTLLGIFCIAVQWILAETMFVTLSTKQEAATEEENATTDKSSDKPSKKEKAKAEKKDAKAKEKEEKKAKKEKPVKEKRSKKEKGKKANLAENTISEKSNKESFDATEVSEVDSVIVTPEMQQSVAKGGVGKTNAQEFVMPTYEVDEDVERLKKQWQVPEERTAQKAAPISTAIFDPAVNNTPSFGNVAKNAVDFDSLMNNSSEFVTLDIPGAMSEDTKSATAEASKKEEETKQEEVVSNDNVVPEEEDPNLEALRKKWLAKYDDVARHSPVLDTRLLAEQQVHCPRCNTLLHVRFGWTKAKCSKCCTIFELRKRGQDYFKY